jgi:serine/threonine-protein kinase RsbW
VSEILRLRIPARPEYLVLGRLVLSGVARCRPIHPDDLSDLKLALTEACSNSVRHAYGFEPGIVEISYELDGDTIAIEVVDHGPGFDLPVSVADGGLGEGGLGLAIIEAVSDGIEIDRRHGETGSRLRFSKRLSLSTDEVP